jgi:replication factor C subunit 2/4
MILSSSNSTEVKTKIKKKKDLNLNDITSIYPWIEKYRPVNLKDVILDPLVYKKILVYIQNRNLNHLIITGTPGIGKTTTAICIAKEILKESFDEAFMELNASDERGVKTVNEPMTTFCNKKISYGGHRIILLDEADNITTKAQRSINTLMESYGKTTRIIFTCNDSSKIIESIQSKCDILRFKKLSNEQIKSYILKICDIENVPFTEDGIDAIIYSAKGDMRQAINNIQSTHCGFVNINKENVFLLCDIPNPETIKNIVKLCINKDFCNGNKEVLKLKNDGYLLADIIIGFLNVLKDIEIDENLRMKYLEIVSQTNMEVSKGNDTELQLNAMICKMIQACGKNYKSFIFN